MSYGEASPRSRSPAGGLRKALLVTGKMGHAFRTPPAVFLKSSKAQRDANGFCGPRKPCSETIICLGICPKGAGWHPQGMVLGYCPPLCTLSYITGIKGRFWAKTSFGFFFSRRECGFALQLVTSEETTTCAARFKREVGDPPSLLPSPPPAQCGAKEAVNRGESEPQQR